MNGSATIQIHMSVKPEGPAFSLRFFPEWYTSSGHLSGPDHGSKEAQEIGEAEEILNTWLTMMWDTRLRSLELQRARLIAELAAAQEALS